MSKRMAETVSQALIDLAELKECETTQRDAVSVLEISGPPSLLPDALITHGITLARLGQTERAELMLERAIETALRVGNLDKAGVAALTMIEELEHLSREALITTYERASTWLGNSSSLELLQRLANAARKVFVRLMGKMDPDEALEILLARPTSLHEQIVTSEGTLIIELSHRVLCKKRTAVHRRSRKND
jgi:hypothetical protein